MSGVLEEWQLDQVGLKAYSRWEKSTEDGFAVAVGTFLRIEREGEHLVKHIFKKGANITSQIVDGFDKVISDAGSTLKKAVDSIKHWHH
jgi:N6-adenosine-specific RNA methylase IME4